MKNNKRKVAKITKSKVGAVLMSTAIKIIIAVVVGSLVLGGITVVVRDTVLPKTENKVTDLFNTDTTYSPAETVDYGSQLSSVAINPLSDWDYSISGENIILKDYIGTNTEVGVANSYEIDGVTYSTLLNCGSSSSGAICSAFSVKTETDSSKQEIKKGIKVVSIADGVVATGVAVADGDYTLKSKSIGYQIFDGCTGLELVGTLPTNITNLYRAFCDCANLKAVSGSLPSQTTNIQKCFMNCKKLLILPDISGMSSCTAMDSCFNGCEKASTVNGKYIVPSAIVTMPSAFLGCSNLGDCSISILSNGVTTAGTLFNRSGGQFKVYCETDSVTYKTLALLNDARSFILYNGMNDSCLITDKYIFDNYGKNITSIGHRAFGANTVPENSEAAFKMAFAVGEKYIETDLCFTSDNVMVISHDTTIDRCSNGSGAIANMTFNEINQYIFNEYEVNNAGYSLEAYKTNKILTFEKALLLCKQNNATMVLHLKNLTKMDAAHVDMILEEIKGYENNIIFMDGLVSFSLIQSEYNRINNCSTAPFAFCIASDETSASEAQIVAENLKSFSNTTETLYLNICESAIDVFKDALQNAGISDSVHIWTYEFTISNVKNLVDNYGVEGFVSDGEAPNAYYAATALS